MKITVYTIKDCVFSKQEKEYLNLNKLVFEEKDLETNKDFLTEMLAISNNFAGTPVTRIEKDDGTITVLKGFTKEEFDTTFGFASPELKAEAGVAPTTAEAVPPAKPISPTETISPAPITADVPVSPSPIPTETLVSEPSNQATNNQATVSQDPLKSVMDDLQSKVDETLPPVPPPIEPIQPTPTDLTGSTGSTAPVVPPEDTPAIPDFPAK